MLQLQPLVAAAPEAAEPEVPGCGWFDSSWELRQGLQVIEHTCPDSAARVLGLDGWLMLQDLVPQGLVARQQRECAMMAG